MRILLILEQHSCSGNVMLTLPYLTLTQMLFLKSEGNELQ